MKNTLIKLLFLIVTVPSSAQHMIDRLPENHKGYKLIQLSSPSEVEDYTSYSFEYAKQNSKEKSDKIFVNFRIYKNPSSYREQVNDFTMEDATMEYMQIDMRKMANDNYSIDKIMEAMKDPDGAKENKRGKSEEEVLKEDLNHKKIRDSRFTKAGYKYSRNMMGLDTFRAVLTWGNDRYAAVTATSKAGGHLELQEILTFIKGFEFEKL